MTAVKKTFRYGDHTVTLETGVVARQATGAVMVTMDDTVVLVTAVGQENAGEGRDFFPLTVNYQEKYYAAGEKKLIVELNGWKICPLVCYDLRFPVWIRNKNKQYDVLLFVANWPERRNYPREALLLARAIENQSYVIGVNRIGKDGGDINHSGDSVFINPQGEVISKAKPNEETIMTVALSYSALEEWRKKFPAWMDADKFKLSV